MTGADATGVALGRVDGDDLLDIVFANFPGPDEVCLGLGGGAFSCLAIDPANAAPSLDVALGFVDGDENLDAVFARIAGNENLVCLGDGSGAFSCSPVSTDVDDSEAVALGYLDDDPHLDAVFAGGVESICLGDGLGGFTCSDVVGVEGTATTDVILGPLLDLFLFGDGFESGDLGSWDSHVP